MPEARTRSTWAGMRIAAGPLRPFGRPRLGDLTVFLTDQVIQPDDAIVQGLT